MNPTRLPIIPLGRDAASRLLPFVFGLMTFLAGLALAGVVALSGASEQIGKPEVDRLTVEVQPDQSGDTDARTQLVIAHLTRDPAVAEATAISDDEVAALLQPWLSRDTLPGDLAMPRLIDVRLKSGATPNLAALSEAFATLGPGIKIDDPRTWLDRLGSFGRSLAVVAGIIMALIAAALGVMAVVNTRMALAVHREVVELLHLMGAKDSFIARLFQMQALKVGLIGGALGAAIAAATLYGIGQAVHRLDATIFLDVALKAPGYAVLAALPVATGLIAALTSRVTVLRALKRMP
ncbi:MAG: FtsX-like permease family protein [Alphaproteobacteria bacterium]|nr:FtsX-like permease family protein [Alphaproteobacteria bacterium]